MKKYYKRNLPHYQIPYNDYFITFCLNGSLPTEKIKELREERDTMIKKHSLIKDIKRRNDEIYREEKRYFGKFDHLLDYPTSGPKWLSNDNAAKIVADKLHSFHDNEYELISYCIMPNHVHILFYMFCSSRFMLKKKSATSEYIVTDILRLIKGVTAREANKILNRTGAFWQHESYDHLVRDDDEKQRIIQYIMQNPVKAGLVNDWSDWKWTYCNSTT